MYNADRTLNGYIKEVVFLEMEIQDSDGFTHRELVEFLVVNLGGNTMCSLVMTG